MREEVALARRGLASHDGQDAVRAIMEKRAPSFEGLGDGGGDVALHDVHSLVNAGGRGTLRGVVRDPDGRVMVSVAQEMLLRPV